MAGVNNHYFRVLDHSGDLRIEAHGEDILEAVAHASAGLVAQIAPLENIQEREEKAVSGAGDDDTARIVAFLNEILYLIYVRHWLPRRIRTLKQCSSQGCRELQAVVAGEPLDPARHVLKYDVKAVTYHDFIIENRTGETVIRFVCDL